MPIDWAVFARAIHVLGVVVWIGGVWLVTTILLPAVKQDMPEQWMRGFNMIERRFAPQARIAVLLVLLSGLYMLYAYDLWDRFTDGHYWWMHLMVGVWLLFAVVLYIIEPLVIRRRVHRHAAAAPQAMLARILWIHRAMLALSVLAIVAAVAGSHGLF
jgi:uncharacterized membrane protein